jgi:hypothetical protein
LRASKGSTFVVSETPPAELVKNSSCIPESSKLCCVLFLKES